jgi:hypothetical protein
MCTHPQRGLMSVQIVSFGKYRSLKYVGQPRSD